MNLKKFFLYTLIVSVAISAVIGIGVVLFGNFGDVEMRVLMTTFTVTCTSILGLACGAYLETGRGRIMPYAGIAFSIVAAVLSIFLTWQRGMYTETIGDVTVSTSMLATACALLSLVSMARLDARFKWSYYLLHMAVWTLCAVLLFIIWFNPPSGGELVPRLIGTLSIVIAAFTIMTPVFHKLSQKAVASADIDAEIAQLKARIEELERKKAELT